MSKENGIDPQRDYPTHPKGCPCSGCYASVQKQWGEKKGREQAASDLTLLQGHVETQKAALRAVLAVLDGSGEFQCGPKGRHLLLREQIRALVSR